MGISRWRLDARFTWPTPSTHRDQGCAHAQPEERRSHDRAAPADRRHRRQRLRQVVAGLRHDLRRGAAPLRRVAVGLRAPVPRADGAARRRSVEGMPPAIAIRQKNSIRNPRSTVGTTTETHDYLRLLFARVGRTVCRQCGSDVARETAEAVAERLAQLPRARACWSGSSCRLSASAGSAGRGRDESQDSDRAGREDDAPELDLLEPPPPPIRWPRPSTCCGARASPACSSTARRSASTRSIPRRSPIARRSR